MFLMSLKLAADRGQRAGWSLGGQSLFCGSDAETEPAILRFFILVIDGEVPISKREEQDAKRHPKI